MAVAIVATLSVVAPAEGQAEIPLCPDESLALDVDVPGYVTTGAGFQMSVLVIPGHVVKEVRISYRTDEIWSEPETVALPESGELDLIRSAPEQAGRFGVAVGWTQDTGTQAACLGAAEYTPIPNIEPGQSVGDPAVAQLKGRYRMTWRDQTPSTWTMRPRCDVFGCGTDFKSSRGLAGKLALSDDTYTSKHRYRWGYCTLQYLDGRAAKRTIFATETYKLRIVGSREGIATRLKGTVASTFDIPSNSDEGCDTPSDQIRRITARRLG